MNETISKLRDYLQKMLSHLKRRDRVIYDDEGIPLTPEFPHEQTTLDAPKERHQKTKLKLPIIEWDRLLHLFFSPKSRGPIHQTFVVLMVITIAFSIGKIIGLNLTEVIKTQAQVKKVQQPQLPRIDMTSDLTTIAKANLFNTRQIDPITGVASKRIQKNIICIESETETTLPVKLVNTVVLQDTVKSLAAVSVRNGPDPVELREGDRLEGLLQLGKIDRLKIIFRNLSTGDCEYSQSADLGKELFQQISNMKILSPSQGAKLMTPLKKMEGIENDGNSYNISKKLRDKLLLDTTALLTQAKAIPLKNPDGTLAYKITEIVPGSVYSHLNIQDGDVITAIDGKPIKNMNEILNLFGRIKSVDHLQLTVQRNAADQVMDYNFR